MNGLTPGKSQTVELRTQVSYQLQTGVETFLSNPMVFIQDTVPAKPSSEHPNYQKMFSNILLNELNRLYGLYLWGLILSSFLHRGIFELF